MGSSTNGVVNTCSRVLSSIRGVRVEVEPKCTDPIAPKRRNDLRVWGTAASGTATSEHDVKVYSIFGSGAHSSFGNDPAHPICPSSTTPIWDRVGAQIERYLRQIARQTREAAPGGIGKFSAIVMTRGGFVE